MLGSLPSSAASAFMSEVSEAAFPTAPAAAAFAVFPCPSSGPAHAIIFAGGRFYCSKCGLFIVLEIIAAATA